MTDPARAVTTLAVAVLVLALLQARPKPQPLRDADEDRAAAFRKAVELERLGQYPAALQALQTLPRTASDYALDVRLGWLHYLAGEYATSAWYYEHAQTAAPQAIEPRSALLLPLLALQRYADVERHARIVLTAAPDHYLASLRLTVAYRLQGKYAVACALNERLLELYPSDVDFLLEQAWTLAYLGRLSEAKTYYRRILLLVPDNAAALRGLAAL